MNPWSSQPEIIPARELALRVRSQGYALVSPDQLAQWIGSSPDDFAQLSPSWNALPKDEYLRDGGRYRRRRHSCFVLNGELLRQTPSRAHWQPLEYNALHGGMERWFEPIDPAVVAHPAFSRLLISIGSVCSELRGDGEIAQPWFVECHQFRIDTTDGIGRPTPEGAHRDGVDFVAVLLVARHQIKGGESRVFEADGPHGMRFTLTEPWTLLLLDDSRVIHETTPIQPLLSGGYRDSLVVTFRSKDFQSSGSR